VNLEVIVQMIENGFKTTDNLLQVQSLTSW